MRGLVTGDADLRLDILRGCPVDNNLAARAQRTRADGCKGVSFTAASQYGIFGAVHLHVMNHWRALAVKLDRDFYVGGRLTPAIFHEDAADQNHVRNFVRGERCMAEVCNVEARFPNVDSRNNKGDEEEDK